MERMRQFQSEGRTALPLPKGFSSTSTSSFIKKTQEKNDNTTTTNTKTASQGQDQDQGRVARAAGSIHMTLHHKGTTSVIDVEEDVTFSRLEKVWVVLVRLFLIVSLSHPSSLDKYIVSSLFCSCTEGCYCHQ